MFYILLCLSREKCGMDIMEEIPGLTGGRVRVGPGTLYNLLEQFAEAGLIRQTRAEGRRRLYPDPGGPGSPAGGIRPALPPGGGLSPLCPKGGCSMKQKKHDLIPFSFYDLTGIARHLEKQAARGWMIEKISN